MGDTNPNELREAISIYRERYGNVTLDMFKLDDIITEMRASTKAKRKKKDDNK